MNLIPRHRHLSRLTLFLQRSRHLSSSVPEDNLGRLRTLLQFSVDRYYICPGQTNIELFQHGLSCSYGPLGMELRRNLLDQWWHSLSTSSTQVFGIKTLNCSKDPTVDGAGKLGIVDLDNVTQILVQKDLNREELIQQVQELLRSSPFMRTSLYQGKVLLHLQGMQVYIFRHWQRVFLFTNLWLQCKTRATVWFLSRCLGAVCPITGAGE